MLNGLKNLKKTQLKTFVYLNINCSLKIFLPVWNIVNLIIQLLLVTLSHFSEMTTVYGFETKSDSTSLMLFF